MSGAGGDVHWITDALLTLAVTVMGFFGKKYVNKVDRLVEQEAAAAETRKAMKQQLDTMNDRLKQEHLDNQSVQTQILGAVTSTGTRIDNLLHELARAPRDR